MKDVKKMTKKERKAYYSQYRTLWTVNPVTRTTKSVAEYKRKKQELKNS